MFAGQKATSYANALKAGRVFAGASDNLPRFEISDREANFSPAAAKEIGHQGKFEGKLGELLHHPALFDAYPLLRHVPVKIDTAPQPVSGEIDGKLNMYVQLDNRTPNGNSNLGVALHEVQHLIQSVENFSRGTSPLFYFQQIGQKRWDSLQAAYTELGRPIDPTSYHGVVHAQAQLAKNARPQLFEDCLLRNAHGPRLANWAQRASFLYLNEPGEIEACEVERRLNMTDEERQKNPPRHMIQVEKKWEQLGVVSAPASGQTLQEQETLDRLRRLSQAAQHKNT